jgi:hypothetical protein
LISAATAIEIAVVFVWTGMVLAISYIETPLKFRAPDVTIRIGLGIGRLVYRALNTVEAILAVVLLGAMLEHPPAAPAATAALVAVVALAVQLGAVRPRLAKRSNAVLGGDNVPRSRAHYAYVALETVKAAALIVAGSLLLAS